MSKSEFGKGLVICLVKFAEHAERLDFFLGQAEDMRKQGKTDRIYEETSAVEMWANGACDHLYDIEVPEGEQWKEVAFIVNELKDKMCSMRNLFGDPNNATVEKARRCQQLARDAAMLIDEALGLSPDEGEW